MREFRTDSSRLLVAPKAAMRDLAEQTASISRSIPPRTRIGYVDYPMHINVGDLLIFLGAMDFFDCNMNDIAVSFCVYDECSNALGILNDVDVIVCHGGGNFGDIYPRHQRLREKLVRVFPHKPIVVLPQSFHFGSEAAMKESASVFRRHPDVTIHVRDEPSYQVARRYFSDRVELCPDMAHRLYEWFAPIRSSTGDIQRKPLRLIRRDVEASLASGRTEAELDWVDIMRLWEKVRVERHRLGTRVRGNMNISYPRAVFAYRSTVQSIMKAIAERMIRFDPWITSRLHGAIFGLLLERTVEIKDNSYGKNSRYFDQWGSILALGSSTTAGPCALS